MQHVVELVAVVSLIVNVSQDIREMGLIVLKVNIIQVFGYSVYNTWLRNIREFVISALSTEQNSMKNHVEILIIASIHLL